ncbi:MAG: MgtC/SapB family protein [Chloroflexi bacterium]|nr:MgtC/SapB family protein [Chloroflexota bacterium]
MDQTDLFIRFITSIAIGFLIGLQREYAHGAEGREIVAGERTFALLSLSGFLGAMLSIEFNSALIFLAVLLVAGAFVLVGHIVVATRSDHIGITTEVAVLVAILIGALCYLGHLTLAVAIGISTTVLLSLKLETDRLVRALTREDMVAALQLAVISAIILPVLPNQSFWPEPFDVLNPFKIWLLVVFISGISFLGYVLIKFVGPKQGIGLTGLLGGMVSSTAVTLSFSERSQHDTKLAKSFALGISVAWTVMFSRVLIEVGILNPALLKVVWLPLSAAGLIGLAYGVYLFFSQRSDESGEMEFSNPFDLGAAVKFGLLYGAVLLVSRTAQVNFGDTGVFLSSIVSGLADVDAITLSMSELSLSGGLELDTAARAIVLATMSNTLVKGGIVLAAGAPALRRALLPGFLLILATGIGMAFIL